MSWSRAVIYFVLLVSTCWSQQKVTVKTAPAPRIIKYVEPGLPSAVWGERAGTVRVELFINNLGYIASSRILEGDPILAGQVVVAAKGWRYEPTVVNGRAVGTSTVVTVEFSPPTLQSSGSTLRETDLYQVFPDTTYGGWCLHQSDRDQANVNIIFKVGPDYDLSVTPESRRLLETEIWGAIEKHCSPLRSVNISNYVYGVRISALDEEAEFTYGQSLPQHVRERAINEIFVWKEPNGSFAYRATGNDGHRSLAELRRHGNGLKVWMEQERIARAAVAKATGELRATMTLTPFDTGGMVDGKVFADIYHGQTELREEEYPFRLLFTRYLVEFYVRCRDFLPPDRETITAWGSEFALQTTTTVFGRGLPVTTTVPVEVGRKPVGSIEVAPKYGAKLQTYTGPKVHLAGDGSGLGVKDLLNLPKLGAVRQAILRDTGLLFARNACDSPTLEVFGENLHRLSNRMPSLQLAAAVTLARQKTLSLYRRPANGRLDESQIIAAFFAERARATTNPYEVARPEQLEDVNGTVYSVKTIEDIYLRFNQGKQWYDHRPIFFKSRQGTAYVAGIPSNLRRADPGLSRRFAVLEMPWHDIQGRIMHYKYAEQPLIVREQIIEDLKTEFPSFRLAMDFAGMKPEMVLDAARDAKPISQVAP